MSPLGNINKRSGIQVRGEVNKTLHTILMYTLSQVQFFSTRTPAHAHT